MMTFRQALNQAYLLTNIHFGCAFTMTCKPEIRKTRRDKFLKLLKHLDTATANLLKDYWIARYNAAVKREENFTNHIYTDEEYDEMLDYCDELKDKIETIIKAHSTDKIEYHKGKPKDQDGVWHVALSYNNVCVYQIEEVGNGGKISTQIKKFGPQIDDNFKAAGLYAWKHNNECGFYDEP